MAYYMCFIQTMYRCLWDTTCRKFCDLYFICDFVYMFHRNIGHIACTVSEILAHWQTDHKVPHLTFLTLKMTLRVIPPLSYFRTGSVSHKRSDIMQQGNSFVWDLPPTGSEANIPPISKSIHPHDMVHVPAKFWENTAMRLRVTARKLNVTDWGLSISPVPEINRQHFVTSE